MKFPGVISTSGFEEEGKSDRGFLQKPLPSLPTNDKVPEGHSTILNL